VLHLRAVDLSIAPTVAGGVSFDSAVVDTFGGYPCGRAVRTSAGWAFDAGLAFGGEVRVTPWLGLRAAFETSVDLAEAQGVYQYQVVSLSAFAGPVLRF